MRAYRLLAVASALLLPSTGSAEDLVGRATVIDGDTIEIHGQRVRLEGIDAPESNQRCRDRQAGTDVRCGQQASIWLADLIGTSTVSCADAGRDRYGRVLAHCTVNGKDIGAAMVEAGWALAFVRYSREYEPQEAKARDAKRGIWKCEFAEPWKWRGGTELVTPPQPISGMLVGPLPRAWAIGARGSRQKQKFAATMTNARIGAGSGQTPAANWFAQQV